LNLYPCRQNDFVTTIPACLTMSARSLSSMNRYACTDFSGYQQRCRFLQPHKTACIIIGIKYCNVLSGRRTGLCRRATRAPSLTAIQQSRMWPDYPALFFLLLARKRKPQSWRISIHPQLLGRHQTFGILSLYHGHGPAAIKLRNRKLSLIQTLIQLAALHKLAVRALFDDLSAVHDHNKIGIDDRAEPVGDNETRPALHQS
jgi:hypothetical protein